MKYIFRIPILVLMVWASGYSYASIACIALGSGDVEAFVTNACPNANNGAINLVLNGGTPSYTIQYFNDQNTIVYEAFVTGNNTTEDAKNLKIGVYRIEVVDGQCAKAVLEVGVGVSEILITGPTPAVICIDGTGEITTTVTGGTEPYTYL